MRKILLGAVFLIAATAGASADPWDHGGRGPGWGGPGWGGRPAYGWGGYDAPRFGPRLRCFWREGYWGPRRVCVERW
ncbi:MAG: hypothetical protein JO048_16995 [Methylobacteriaceae bacterium]|nr:hypothetical protein [Methylobacteriaceae bacterium]